VICGFDIGAHPRIHRVIIREINRGLYFITSVFIERRLTQDFARQAEADTPVLAVFLRGQVIKNNRRRLLRVCAFDADMTATLRFIGTNVNLKTMPIKSRLAIVAYGSG
jgi:hypothetical protein